MKKVLLQIELYNIDNICVSRATFDGYIFYERTFVQLADKYNIVELDIKYRKNSRESFELRKTRRLSDDDKTRVVSSDRLTNDERFIVDLISKDCVSLDCDEVKSRLSGVDLSNVSDIADFLENNNKSIKKVVFKKIVEESA